jgi:hypothetical protein
VDVSWQKIVEVKLEKENPFARLLSSRDLLEEAAGEEPTAAEAGTEEEEGPELPTSGDPEAWQALARLLEKLPQIDKSRLGQEASSIGLTRDTLNDKLGLGLEGKVRKAWNHALNRLVECGLLVDLEDGTWELARRVEAQEQASAEAIAEAEPLDPALQKVIDHYVGAMARRWKEAA